MDKDGVYRPDRTIRDVYEDGSDAHKYEELGLSPYARIGSLAGDSATEENFKRPSKPKLNLHAYTFVGPLVGETLSPADRLALKPIYKKRTDAILAARKLPGLIAAAIAYISRTKRIGQETLIAAERSRRTERYVSLSNAVPVFVSFIAVLLLVFAAVVSPDRPVANPNGGGNPSLGGSSFSNPNIIDNRALFPLSIFQDNSHDNNHRGSSKASPGGNTNQAAPYNYVSPTYAQPAATTNTTSVAPSTGGSVSVPSTVSQPASSTLTQPTSGSSVIPSGSGTSLPSTSSSGSGSIISTPSTSAGGGALPTINTSGGGVSQPTTSGSGGSGGLSVPGVTSPTSVSTPSASVSSPLSSKPLISTSPTTLTLN